MFGCVCVCYMLPQEVVAVRGKDIRRIRTVLYFAALRFVDVEEQNLRPLCPVY